MRTGGDGKTRKVPEKSSKPKVTSAKATPISPPPKSDPPPPMPEPAPTVDHEVRKDKRLFSAAVIDIRNIMSRLPPDEHQSAIGELRDLIVELEGDGSKRVH